ncbi:MAG: CotH kinase family protein [Anaerolineae bacterium]|nr:CotH kinase family protein [Anaerolineae bacterium]
MGVKKSSGLLWIVGLAVIITLSGCSQVQDISVQTGAEIQEVSETVVVQADTEQSVDTSDETVRSDEWDDYSHGKSTEPDYDVVFPQDEVNSITIAISPENWQLMQDNLIELIGEFGTRQGGGGRPGQGVAGGERPEGEPPEGFEPPADGEGMGGRPDGAGGPGGGGLDMLAENPIWVTADIEFDGQSWANVGMRFKGNSSLTGAWGSGILKMGFKLDFDEFEDDYPEIEDQRFYGFQQLSFSSNFNDSSLLWEKVAADIFREAGVPSANTAFYAVYIDYGEGPVYFGLYTVLEMIDDTVIETQFDDDSGNVYKPEGNAASFAEGTYDETDFDKETNQDEADYSDVLALYEALNADTRTTDPETWRSDLEAVFDVDDFLNWLAVNSIIQNWDTYGQMAHNYYLYNDPATGQLTWMPWDNNEALTDRDGGRGGRENAGSSSLDQDDVGENWPLIRYLLDDPVYHERYVGYVENTITSVFVPDDMVERYTALHDMIAPYVIGENGEIDGYTYLTTEDEFDTALAELIDHVYSRYEVAQEYLDTQ